MGTRLVPVVLAALLPFVGACGGGGGGGGGPAPPAPEALLEGTYHAQLFMLSYPLIGVGGPEHPCCEWGRATADGAGSLDVTLRRNVDGDLDPDTHEDTAPYVVDADRTLALLHPADLSIRLYEGRAAADGRLATLAKRVADEQPAIMLMERRDGTAYGDASLLGLYVVCGFFAQPAATSVYGGAVIGTPGSGTATLATNKEGDVSSPSSSAITYSIAANGDTTMSIGGLTDLVGGTLRNGALAIVAGAALDGKPPTLVALVRASSDRTEADFHGTYSIVGWQYDVSEHRHVAMAGTLVADGAGGYTTSITMTDGVAVLEDVAGGGTYDISMAGVILATNTLGDVYTGGLSEDGSYAVVSGSINLGQDPVFYFLHR